MTIVDCQSTSNHCASGDPKIIPMAISPSKPAPVMRWTNQRAMFSNQRYVEKMSK